MPCDPLKAHGIVAQPPLPSPPPPHPRQSAPASLTVRPFQGDSAEPGGLARPRLAAESLFMPPSLVSAREEVSVFMIRGLLQERGGNNCLAHWAPSQPGIFPLFTRRWPGSAAPRTVIRGPVIPPFEGVDEPARGPRHLGTSICQITQPEEGSLAVSSRVLNPEVIETRSLTYTPTRNNIGERGEGSSC